MAESGSESNCGRLKVHPQSEQCPVCGALSLALSSMVLSTSREGGEEVSFFGTSESYKHIMFMIHSDVVWNRRAIHTACLYHQLDYYYNKG